MEKHNVNNRAKGRETGRQGSKRGKKKDRNDWRDAACTRYGHGKQAERPAEEKHTVGKGGS